MARRKRKLSPIMLFVIGAHLAIGAALALIPQQTLREVVSIALQEGPKPEAKPKPAEPPRPARAESEPRAHAARAPRAAASQPSAAATETSTSAFTDLGLTLDSSSADGLAVNMGPAHDAVKAVAIAPSATAVRTKVLAPKQTEEVTNEPPPKPKPIGIVKPTYTEAARRAHIQGRVRLELLVNEQGEVTEARVLEGLGYGLDEAALAAAKNLRFAAATRDGRPVPSKFVLAMRFVLGT